jgi:hypothetical protein
MPDHVPQIDGRDPSGVAFAYCYGYIQAGPARRPGAAAGWWEGMTGSPPPRPAPDTG